MAEILFLAHRIPYPPNKGDKIRSWNTLLYLTKHHKVHLGCFVDDEDDWRHLDRLKSVCAECYFAPLGPKQTVIRSAIGLLTGAALTTSCYRDATFMAWVAGLLNRCDIGCVYVFSSAMAQYVLERPDVPRRIMDFGDIDSDKWNQYADRKSFFTRWIYRREGRRLLDFERRIAHTFDTSLFVSRCEADDFRQLVAVRRDKINYVNNGVDAEYFSPDRQYDAPFAPGPVIVFTGAMDYWPNVDAVVWFVEQVWPTVHGSVPKARFVIVGAKPGRKVKALQMHPGVEVTGRVPDVRPYLAHAASMVAPLRISRGIQNKVLEGMSMALPVVATPAAARGLDAEIGRELLVCEGAGDMVATITGLLHSQDNREIGRRARLRVLEAYSWEGCLDRLEMIVQLPGLSIVESR